jgi:hypothetical protein
VYQPVVTTGYVGNTETRAYLVTWKCELNRLYRVTLNVGSVDVDGPGDNSNTDIRYAKNSAVIRARWKYGTDCTVTDSDLGYRLVTVFDDDSMTSTGVTAEWHVGGFGTAGDVAVAITLATYRAAATYGNVRLLTNGASANTLRVEDVGPWPVV